MTPATRALLAHERDLYRLALALCGGKAQDALDLTQDTFVKALRKLDRFEPGTNLRAWLSQIMRNTFIDDRRRRRREPVAAEPIDLAPRHPLAGPGDDLPGAVLAALDELEPETRALLLLSDVQGYRYREIAEILDIPIGTGMSRLHRARKKLRERLEPSRAA
jgi:RNA polymerase sigma-70 factor (ECF subfamily)